MLNRFGGNGSWAELWGHCARRQGRLSFALVATLAGMFAFLAAAIPARRAARIDPQMALRTE
jgi:hypothetical protein